MLPPIAQNPVEFWNSNQDWTASFGKIKGVEFKGKDIFIEGKKASLRDGKIYLHEPFSGLSPDQGYSPFQIFSHIQHKGDYRSAIFHIEYYHMGVEIPYIRVGTDYLKIINKKDQYNVSRRILKPWKKDEIKQDHGPAFLKLIHHYDDFCIEPDNFNYQEVIDNCFNLYSSFSHTPSVGVPTEDDIPASIGLLMHIFGDQYELGLIYMKCLVEMPKQILPILCLVSEERKTGKTTFLNWLNVLFGDNFIRANPEDITSQFNAAYATKNVIALDETASDKVHVVEKLKSLTTTPGLSVNQKHVSSYSVPFYGKVVICSNKETDFLRIDSGEIRFWIRKVNSLQDEDYQYLSRLTNEIPYFLKYLQELPPIKIKTRMVFRPEDITNESLKVVQRESWSGLKKELIDHVIEFFNRNGHIKSFLCSSMDIKDQWYAKNNTISSPYIYKVLTQEMKMTPIPKMRRYQPFQTNHIVQTTKPGKPFEFQRSDYKDFVDDFQPEIDLPF